MVFMLLLPHSLILNNLIKNSFDSKNPFVIYQKVPVISLHSYLIFFLANMPSHLSDALNDPWIYFVKYAKVLLVTYLHSTMVRKMQRIQYSCSSMFSYNKNYLPT